ncbi:MAG: peptidoglycan DD-metalloendopeptidase family protein [Candidatus Avelusimicrobium sp.]|uniref:peptidoglycan DD-metalloendopeptidase family protein n=1 Tax=Candidatus Avelusimicrobium sp. TaxID=3048833 RepID=UPI003F12AE31
MKDAILNFLNQNYRRYHDVLFYVLTLAVIAVSTAFALHVTRHKNELERENLRTREIPVMEYTVGRKPVYVALQEAGLSNQTVAQIVSKLSTVADTRKLQKNDVYSVSVEGGQFVLLVLTQGFKRYYVANVEGALVAGVSDVEIKTRIKTAAGKIKGSLFNSMLGEGLQVPLILDFTDAFSWTIDFNTDTRNGDEYTALWEENYTASGEITSQDLLAASYKGIYGTTYAFYFEDDFYDETGKMSKKMFLKSPISFRNYRISSRFSYGRLHPILKIRRPHLGIDYAAPTGTPVQAVADGTVKFAGKKGGFGNFVEVKHANGYTTMYGHLKSYGKGVKAGAKVKQGQTVGYVGSTGLSTGPHLDFRIKEKNKFVDFLKMKNRNSAVRDVPQDKREEFEELKVLYLKELDAAKQSAQPAAPEESHEA